MAKAQWAKEFHEDYDNRPGRCPVCGLLFVKADPEDAQMHREFHRKILSIYEPNPNKLLAERVVKHGPFITITPSSSERLRQRLFDMGRMWKRELGYDFPPYDMHDDDGRSYLIVAKDGRAIGGFTVRWREFSDAPSRWRLTWIWIVPIFRRRGFMRQAWNFIRPQFEHIEPEPPFSLGLAEFFSGRMDVSEKIRALAKEVARKANSPKS